MFALLVLSAQWVRADGMLYQLPNDGAWATYEFTASAKTTGGTADDAMNFKGTLTLASVGQVVVQGEPCRWIEVQLGMNANNPNEKRGEVYKILVPEKFLTKGQSPLAHVLQAWLQRGGEQPQKLTDPGDINIGPLPIILSGPWNNVTKLEKVEIDGKLGKLSCEGTQGTLDFKMGSVGKMLCRLENRLNDKSPFGAVACNWSLELPEVQGKKAVIYWSLKLLDVGGNAVSKLPNVK
jgi:hypothetical protein